MSDKKSTGSLMFVLHSHLPYVLCHGRSPHGTDWLTEAAAECYIPLLDALYDLVEEGVSPKVTIGITPVLTEMLADPIFAYEFITYLQDKILAAERDEKAFKESAQDHLAYLAGFWRERFTSIFRNFRVRYNKSIVNAFKELQDAGHIEIITSSATHGYSPLLASDTSVQAQVKQGIQTYRRHYGKDPRGYWLPECAYRPRYEWSRPVSPDGTQSQPYLRKGVEEFLGENGIRYFMVESHLIKGYGNLTAGTGDAAGAHGAGAGVGASVYADRFPGLKQLWSQFASQYASSSAGFEHDYSIYQAHYIAGKGEVAEPVAVFARDPKTGHQVWSAASGYPGDEWYLEFHKKRVPGGHRYHRVTGPQVDLGYKREYDPYHAQQSAESHAHHFIEVVKGVLREESAKIGAPAVICAAYDTELYGHWWFEGVDWLKAVLRRAAADPEIQLMTGNQALDNHASSTPIPLPEGSWGEGGFHWVWLNSNTEWTWKLVYKAEDRMRKLSELPGDNPVLSRLVKQAARELLLLQSSDWQFNITTSGSTDYAELRLNWHYESFCKLADLAESVANGAELDADQLDILAYREERDTLFMDVDPAWFARLENPPKQ